MKYCHHCAGPVLHEVPTGDDRPRFHCPACDVVFYQNPNNIVGTLPVFGDRVLLCRRAIEPRLGYWTLPAGFMENGETSLAGALRETREEAGALVHPESSALYALFNLPHINQVYLFFLAQLQSEDFSGGPESLEVKLLQESEIPWQSIAFAVVRKTLELYFADRKEQRFPVRMYDVHYGTDRRVDMRLISSSEESRRHPE